MEEFGKRCGLMEKKEKDNNKNFLEAVGQALKSIRVMKGLSQKDLSELTGSKLTPSYIGRIESGKQNTSLDTIDKIVNSLGLDFSQLVSRINILTKDLDDEKERTIAYLIEKFGSLTNEEVIMFSDIFEVIWGHIKKMKDLASAEKEIDLDKNASSDKLIVASDSPEDLEDE